MFDFPANTQLYFVIKPPDDWSNVNGRLEPCLSEISAWMKSNMLKLNEDKQYIFGPSTDPCGTPYFNSMLFDLTGPIATRCDLPCK
jgi:hypothetical protein